MHSLSRLSFHCALRRAAGWILSLAAAGTALLTGCARFAVPPASGVATVIVQRAVMAEPAVEAWSGAIRARQHATLSFPVGGRLQRLLVDVGDRVEAGSVLAELDQEPFVLELSQADAEMQAAGPVVAEAKRRRDAEERLWAAGASSRTDYDAAVSAHAAAAGRLQAAEASLGIAKRQLRESRLIAPAAGRVAQRLAQSPTWVAPGMPVLEFDDDGAVEAVLAVPSARLDALSIGQEMQVHVRLAEPSAVRVTGRVSHIGRRSLAGGVHEVLVRLPAHTPVYPGEAVLAEGRTPSVLAEVRLPLTAVLPSAAAGAGHVFVFAESSGRVEHRAVRYRAPQGAEVRIGEGLKAGETVVVAGVSFLRDGQTVQPQRRD